MPKPLTSACRAPRDRAPRRRAGQLPHRLDQPEIAAGRARLSHRQLAAAGVERKVAVHGEVMAPHERRSLALAAESQILELQQRDHRIVVIGLHQVDRLRPDPRLRPQRVAIHRPAAAQLHRIVGKRIVPLDRAEQAHIAAVRARRARAFHHQESVGAGAGHHAVDTDAAARRSAAPRDRRRASVRRAAAPADCAAHSPAAPRTSGRNPRASRRMRACRRR